MSRERSNHRLQICTHERYRRTFKLHGSTIMLTLVSVLSESSFPANQLSMEGPARFNAECADENAVYPDPVAPIGCPIAPTPRVS